MCLLVAVFLFECLDVCCSCFPVDPALKTQMEDLRREEVEFVYQYDQWKQQYHEWQEQNKSMCLLEHSSVLFAGAYVSMNWLSKMA